MRWEGKERDVSIEGAIAGLGRNPKQGYINKKIPNIQINKCTYTSKQIHGS